MKRWIRLATATAPDGQEFTLWDRDGERVIRVGLAELMSTRQHSSEERLAELTCARAAKLPAAHVLVGGMGFGFTLGAALRFLSPDARVTVSEVIPAVIEWNKDPALNLPGGVSLKDPRVHVVVQDVVRVLSKNSGAFDAIMLDVDNGPSALSTDGNEMLYEDAGLYLVRGALKRGGIAGFWSAAPDASFAKRLGKAGFAVEVDTARAHAEGRSGMGGGSRHTLFIAKT